MDLAEVADRELDGLDPYELMRSEAARIDAFLAHVPPDGWAEPTGCAGWDRHDLVAHLAGSEQYNHACLDDRIGELMGRAAEAGVTDVDSFNRWTVDQRRDADHDAVVHEWREALGRTIRDLADRDGGDIPTMVGPYPARWQGFHLAAELATHADDLGVGDGPAGRLRWRAHATRFFLAESHPELAVEAHDGGTTVSVGDVRATLDDATLVAAANRRLRDPDSVAAAVRDAVALM